MCPQGGTASAGGPPDGFRTDPRTEAFHSRILSKSGFWRRIQESDSWIGLRDRWIGLRDQIQGSNSGVEFMSRLHILNQAHLHILSQVHLHILNQVHLHI